MSNDCKLIKDLRDKISKLVAVVKEHRAETKQVNEPPKPEEIEMEVFYRRPFVTIKEPAYEERWSVIRRRPGTPTQPIDIIYPVREQDWFSSSSSNSTLSCACTLAISSTALTAYPDMYCFLS